MALTRLGFVMLLVAATCTACRASPQSGPSTTYVTLPTFAVNVPSSSMEPTLHCAKPASGCEGSVSDGVVVQPLAQVSEIKRGDIVLFNVPELAKVRCGAGGRFLKRIIGMPGETWEERQGYVYINGKRLDEPYIASDRRDFQTRSPVAIPSDAYFILGDNRASSCDSRVWGVVPAANIVGRVVKIVRVR